MPLACYPQVNDRLRVGFIIQHLSSVFAPLLHKYENLSVLVLSGSHIEPSIFIIDNIEQ